MRLDRGERVRVAVIVVLLALVLFVLPSVLSLYWIDVLIGMAVYSIVTLSLGLLMGRVGLVSLGQIAILALGAWVAARLDFATSLPFPLVLLASGLITMVLGTLVGPARAAAERPLPRAHHAHARRCDQRRAERDELPQRRGRLPRPHRVVVRQRRRAPARHRPERPRLLPLHGRSSPRSCSCIALWHVRAKPGRAWAAIRQSEPAALAAGVNITLYKLWAFALASFLTGVAGGAARPATWASSTRTSSRRATRSSLLAVVLMGGIYSLWGAVVAGGSCKPAAGAAGQLGPARPTC